MDAVTLQPAAGAHGEMTGILLIRALLESRGDPRKRILIRIPPRHQPGERGHRRIRRGECQSNASGLLTFALERLVMAMWPPSW